MTGPATPGDDRSRELAFATDTRRALADAGLNEHEIDCVEAYYAGRHSVGIGRDPREFLRVPAQPGEVPALAAPPETETAPHVLVVDADRDEQGEYLRAIAPPATARQWAEADLVVDRLGRVLKWRGRVASAGADPYGLDPYGTGDGSYPEGSAER